MEMDSGHQPSYCYNQPRVAGFDSSTASGSYSRENIIIYSLTSFTVMFSTVK